MVRRIGVLILRVNTAPYIYWRKHACSNSTDRPYIKLFCFNQDLHCLLFRKVTWTCSILGVVRKLSPNSPGEY